jgi:sec-independent protein translocase protein TatA
VPGFHTYDLIVLAILALLFFGPKRLPEMGSAIGKTIKEFQKSMHEVTTPTEAPAQTVLPAATVQPVQAPQIATSAPEVAREIVSTPNSAAPVEHPNG